MSDLGELTVLPSLIAAVRKESPQSTVHTLHAQIADVHALLESGEADLAISGYPPGNVEIYQQKLFARSSIVLANRHVHGGEELSLETYCQAAHVAIVPVLGGISAVDQVLAKHKLQRNVVVTTQHHLVIPFLLDGDPSLIATVPQDMAPAWRRHEDLRSFPLPFEFPSFEVSQFWHGRFHTDRTHVWFRKLVAECFQSASPGGVPRFQPDEIMSGANNDD
jgi:DNA-binding transcriptional LysR family regulator